MDKTYKAEEKIEQKNEKADKFNAAPYSTGKVAASFTSTAMNRETVHEAAIIEEDIVRYSRVKKKGKLSNAKKSSIIIYIAPITNELIKFNMYFAVFQCSNSNFISHFS